MRKIETPTETETAPSIKVKTTRERVMEEKELKSRMVKCRFINQAQPHATIGPFPLRLYPGKIEVYEFKHGEEYTVPEYVLDHINQSVGETEYYNVVDEKGRLIPKPNKKARFQLSVIAYL